VDTEASSSTDADAIRRWWKRARIGLFSIE